MRIALLSPYHGGSHQAWAEGYQRHSVHEVRLWTLPARFWKWRMHGGAVTLALRFSDEENPAPNLILATDMLDLTTFLSLTRRQTAKVPAVLYMHENQLTYPLPDDPGSGPMRRQHGERDRHYGFINFASMLAADQVLFNSRFHMESLFEELPRFLRHFPEYNELGSVERLKSKSEVLPVGIYLSRFAGHTMTTSKKIATRLSSDTPPLIIWNQRWEYDKNPEAFFNALYSIQGDGIPFRLALCGQQFGRRPPVFETALTRLSNQIVHVGHANEETYIKWLVEANITVSTASHEFFGISVIEAIACQTFPILPNRLSYPEIIPECYHNQCLYEDESGLLRRLRWALSHPAEVARLGSELAAAVRRYDWAQMAGAYDSIMERCVNSASN